MERTLIETNANFLQHQLCIFSAASQIINDEQYLGRTCPYLASRRMHSTHRLHLGSKRINQDKGSL